MTNCYKRGFTKSKSAKFGTNKILILILTALMFLSLGLSAVLAFSSTFATDNNPQSNPWSGAVATGFGGGTGSQEDPFLIQNGEQLAYLSMLVNEVPNYSVGKHFLLTNDILLNDTSNSNIWSVGFAPKNIWTPIGDFDSGADKKFSGTFDGGDFSIFGLYVNSNKNFRGLFGFVFNGTIKNLNLEKSWVKGVDSVGGIVGRVENGTLENLSNSSTVNGNTNVGGISGNLISGTITKSSNNGRVVSNANTGGVSFVGGIAGKVGNSVLSSLWVISEEGTGVGRLESCFNTGYISGDGLVGGLVGGLLGTNQSTLSSVENSFNKGTVFATTRFSGGIAGFVALGNIENCFNDGSIAGGGRVGGITGGVTGAASIINICLNFNSVTGGTVDDLTGGIVAWFAEGTALNLANFGEVTGGSAARVLTGGIVATVGSFWSGISATVYNSVNFGTVNGRANDRTGGIAGQVDNYSLVANCFNAGTVNSTGADLGGVAGRTQYSAFTLLNYYIDNTAHAVGASMSTEESSYGKFLADATITETVGISQIGSLTVSANTKLIDALNAFVSSSLQTFSSGQQFSFWVESENSNFPMLECLVNLKSELLENAGLLDDSQAAASDTPSLGTGVWGGVNDIAAGFAGGNGSKNHPYLISTAAQLNLLRQLVNTSATNATYSNQNVFYELTNNIFLNDISNYDQWENWVAENNTAELQKLNQWTAIGVESATGYFRANFNGKGFSIFGLFANTTSSTVAVFGSCVGANISNLATEKGFLKGNNSVAGIGAVVKEKSVVSNCYSTLKIVSTGQNAGGIIGYLGLDSVVKNCYNFGDIFGVNDVGGVVGDNTDGAIFNCYNVGNVVGTGQQIGGVVGWVYGNAQAENCYNTGNVTGGKFVGGVAGNLYSRVAYDSYVKNSYNTGDVSSISTHVGGVVGYTVASMIVDSYNLGDISSSFVGSAFVGGVVGRAGDGVVIQSIVKNCYNQGNVFGNGTLGDAGTDYVGGVVGAAYGLVAQNAEITNCYNLGMVNSTGNFVGGILGQSTRSNISKNYNSGEVAGGQSIGGVVGYLSYSTMDSCFNTAKIEGYKNSIAGLVGSAASDVFLINSYNLGDVVGQSTAQKVGGLAGTLSTNSKVANSYNHGNIFGQTDVGGIVGSLTTQAEVTNCYNSGKVVSVTSNSGGIAGTATGSKINNTYNSGAVFGVNSVGGVAGDLSLNSSVSNSFNNGLVSGTNNGQGIGGIVGKASSALVNNSVNNANIKGNGLNVGGVVGELTSSVLQNSSNTGEVSSTSDNVGGVVGALLSSSNVYNIISTGNIFGKTNVGGVAGSVDVASTVDFAYFLSGSITVSGALQSSVQEKAIGNGTGKTAKFDLNGVLIQNNGIVFSDGFEIALYSTTLSEALNVTASSNQDLLAWAEFNGKVNLLGVSSVSREEFLNNWVFENPTFSSVKTLSWVKSAAAGQPILSLVNISKDSNGVWGGGVSGVAWQGESDIATSFAGGTGTKTNPYLISTASQLKLLANLINKVDGTVFSGVELASTDFAVFNSKDVFYRLTNDILLNELNNYNLWQLAVAENDSEKLSTLNTWTPIGDTFENSFKANFNGNGFAVLGVFINTTSEVQGLFGWGAGTFLSGESGTETAVYGGGSITNLTVDASFVKGKNYVAGVIAYITDGFVVSGCSNFATVEATNALVGGIVGVAFDFSTVSANFNFGKILGFDHTGGIAGRIVSSTLMDCQNFGAVTGTNEGVGGIVGQLFSGTVFECYNKGTVFGQARTGGVVGWTNNASVLDSINEGEISATSSTGGVVGQAETTTIQNCFNDAFVSGTTCVGGVVGNANLNSVVSECNNLGTVKGSSSQIGGVVGIAYTNSIVLNSMNIGDVFGSVAIGGVAGQIGTSAPSDSAAVENCYNAGGVSATANFVGGVVGNAVSGSTIRNCFNMGEVTTSHADKSTVGGAVGRLDSVAESAANFVFSILGTKAIAKIENTSTHIVGLFDESGVLTEFGTTNSSGTVTSTSVEISLANSGGTTVVASGKTLVDSLNAWVNADQSDTDVTKAVLPDGVLHLNWQADAGIPTFGNGIVPPVFDGAIYLGNNGVWNGEVATGFAGGDGTSSKPYKIANAAQLALLSALINSATAEVESKYNNSSVFYVLTDNIFLNDTSRVSEWSNWSAEQLKTLNNWLPIGKSSTHAPFKANFDGKNYAVHGLYANGKDYIGLFGALSGEVSSGTAGTESAVYSGGTIKNLNIESGFVKGTGYVGGLAGSSMQALFTNCYNNATATVSGVSVGGITGYAESSVLNRCFNTGSIKNTTANMTGGLCGALKYSTVLSSGNSGDVYGAGVDVGGITGQLLDSVVKYSFNEGNITGNGDYVGGIAGVMNFSTASISNSSNSGTVKGNRYVAGISGYAQDYTTNTFNTNSGNIDGNTYVGGIAGLSGTASTLSSCINSGTIVGSYSSSYAVGGVVGYILGTSLDNCVNEGDVYGTKTSSAVGGLIGRLGSEARFGSATNNYSIGKVSGGTNVGEILGLQANGTLRNVYISETATLPFIGGGYAPTSGGTFNKNGILTSVTGTLTNATATVNSTTLQEVLNIWQSSNPINSVWVGRPLPTLDYAYADDYNVGEVWDGTVATTFAGGAGTQANPFKIATAEQLARLAFLANSGDTVFNNYTTHFELVADIYLNDTAGWQNWSENRPANQWTPIGTEANSFKANLNGNGFSVYGMFAGDTDAINQGLFGFVRGELISGVAETESAKYKGATIKNLGVLDGLIVANERAGAILGMVIGGEISNCFSNVTLKCIEKDIGGLIGALETSLLENSYYEGNVSGNRSLGGLVGWAINFSTIVNCYNKGYVLGNGAYIAGIVGVPRISVTVENCLNFGTVEALSSSSYVGGIVGVAGYAESHSTTVSNCTNFGTVKVASTAFVGSIAGRVANTGVLQNSFYLSGTLVVNGVLQDPTQEAALQYSNGGVAKSVGKIDSNGNIIKMEYDASGADVSSQSVTEYTVNGIVATNLQTALNAWTHQNRDTANAKTSYKFFDYISTELLSIAFSDKLAYKASFNVDGGSPIGSFLVWENQKLQKPTDPTKANNTFGGWFADAAKSLEFDFSKFITSDTTVFAKWYAKPATPDNYLVVYNATGGEGTPVTVEIPSGGTVALAPTPPTKKGFNFVGWYSDIDLTTQFVFGVAGTQITRNTYLFAKWEAATISISEGTTIDGGVFGQHKEYPAIVTTGGANGTIEYSVLSNGSLPTGISLDSQTGVLSGTLLKAGTFSFTIRALVLETNEFADKTFEIVVEKATPIVDVAGLLSGVELTFGDRLPSISQFEVVNNNAVAGTFELIWSIENLVAGSNELGWKFVPSDTNNYNEVEGGSLTIIVLQKTLQQMDLELTLSQSTFVYNGSFYTPLQSVNHRTLGLLTEGVDYTVAYSNNKNAGTATISVCGVNNFNGEVFETFLITKANVTVAPIAGQSFVYGSPIAGNLAYNAVGVVDGESLFGQLGWSGQTAVSEYEITQNTLTNQNNANYNITFVSGISLSVTPYIIDLNSLLADFEREISKIFDGNTSVPVDILEELSLILLANLPDNTLTLAVVFADKNVGTAKELIFSLTGENSQNYAFAGSVFGKITTKAIDEQMFVDFSAIDGADYVYTASEIVPIALQDFSTTLVLGVDFNASYSVDKTNVGTVVVTIAGIGNYSGVLTYEFTISKATLTITPDQKTKVFGLSDPTLTYTVDGLKNGDLASAVLTGGLSRVVGDTVGSYDILQGTLSVIGGNYQISFVENIKFVVTKAPAAPIISPMGLSAKFGDTLANVTLPNGWSWVSSGSTSVGAIGTNHFYATFVPDDIENYDYSGIGGWSSQNKRIERDLAISVERKTLEVSMFQSIAAVTFNTLAHTPTVVGASMVLGTDFSVSYSNNINAGTALVTVSGIGNFNGTVTLTFTINKMTFVAGSITHPSLSVSFASGLKLQNIALLSGFVWVNETQLVTLGTKSYDAIYNPDSNNYVNFALKITVNAISDTENLIELDESMFDPIADLTYSGAALTPAVSAAELTLGTDFSVSYSNNINAGTAIVLVTGKNNYIGTVSLEFNILQAQYTPTAPTAVGKHSFGTLLSGWTLSSPEDNGKGVWKWENENNVPSVSNNGYIAVFTLSTSNYVLVGESRAVVTVQVEESLLTQSMFDAIADVTFNGQAHTPTIFAAGLTQGVDFVVTFANNVNVGLGMAEVYGIGNYAGITYLQFVVNKANYSDITLEALSVSWKANKTLESIVLPLGFSWKTPAQQVEAGTHSYNAIYNADSANYNNFELLVTITATVEHPILTELDSTMFDEIVGSFVFNGQEHLPTVSSNTLTYGTDFVVFFTDNVNAGVASALVQGIGNYTGTVLLTFEIQKAPYRFVEPYAIGKHTFGMALGNWEISSDENGFWTWAYSTSFPEVENSGYMAYFTLTNNNFELIETNETCIFVEVEKRLYSPSLPKTSVTNTFGATLASWTLEFSDTIGSWAWKNQNDVPNVLNNGYTAVFTISNPNFAVEGSGEAIVAVTVQKALLLEGMFDAIASMTYSGQQLRPTDIFGANLEIGSDFLIVSYGKNINVSTGGTVVVEGVGNYTGLVELYFEISKANYSDITHPSLQILWQSGLTLASIELVTNFAWQNSAETVNQGKTTYTAIFNADNANYNDFVLEIEIDAVMAAPEVTADMFGTFDDVVYTGLPITPHVASNNGLVQGIHFTVTYFNNQNVGVASILIQGVGVYTGSLMFTFNITRVLYTPTAPVTTDLHVFGAILSQWNLSSDPNGYWEWVDGSAVPTVANSGFVAKYTLTNSNFELTGAETAVVAVTVTPKALSVSMFNILPSFTYSGLAIAPEVTALGLSKGTDFSVGYTNNINAGTAIAKVTGQGNYGGEVELNFTINKKSHVAIAHPSMNVFWSSGMTLLDVRLLTGFSWVDTNTEVLLGNHSYQAIYNTDSQNFNDFQLTVTVNAVTDSSSLVVLTKDMFDAISSVVYNGSQHTPEVVASGLQSGIDFDVFYENNTNAGTAKVLVIGKGDFVGTVELNFVINKAVYTPTAPTSQDTHVFGTSLALWTLSSDARGTWSWKNDQSIPNVKNSGYVAVFTLSESFVANYIVENNEFIVAVSVSKALQSTPSDVVVVAISMSSVKLSEIENAEYSLDNQNWQDSSEFKNLENGTAYTLFVRLKGTDNHIASDSISIEAKTLAKLAVAVQDDLVDIVAVAEDIFDNYVLGEDLPTPVAPVGFEFVGWMDNFGNQVTALTQANHQDISTLVSVWRLITPTISKIESSENADGTRTLTAVLENTNPDINYSFQWWVKTQSATAGVVAFGGQLWQKIEGATANTFVASSSGDYRCEVTAAAGVLTSEASELSVNVNIRVPQDMNWLWITLGIIVGVNVVIFVWRTMFKKLQMKNGKKAE